MVGDGSISGGGGWCCLHIQMSPVFKFPCFVNNVHATATEPCGIELCGMAQYYPG